MEPNLGSCSHFHGIKKMIAISDGKYWSRRPYVPLGMKRMSE